MSTIDGGDTVEVATTATTLSEHEKARRRKLLLRLRLALCLTGLLALICLAVGIALLVQYGHLLIDQGHAGAIFGLVSLLLSLGLLVATGCLVSILLHMMESIDDSQHYQPRCPELLTEIPYPRQPVAPTRLPSQSTSTTTSQSMRLPANPKSRRRAPLAPGTFSCGHVSPPPHPSAPPRPPTSPQSDSSSTRHQPPPPYPPLSSSPTDSEDDEIDAFNRLDAVTAAYHAPNEHWR